MALSGTQRLSVPISATQRHTLYRIKIDSGGEIRRASAHGLRQPREAREYIRHVRTSTRYAITHDVGEALREAAAAASVSAAASASATNAAASAAASAAAAAAAAAYATLVVGGCELEKAHLMKETIRAHPYSPELEKAHLMKVIRSCG